MNDFDMEELIPIVAELADMYTSKESTSIPYTAAQQLMGAVLYCLHENEDNLKIIETSVLEPEGKSDAKLVYEQGYCLVLQKVKRTKLLYEDIIDNFNGYRNRSYIDTIVKGMPQFFLYYDARLNPQNHILTLDYPTIKSIDHICGIDAIYQYLSYVKLEQEFLRAFPENFISELLLHFHEDFEELFINLCSIVLRNTLGHMIIGNNIVNHGFDESEYCLISRFVIEAGRDKLEVKLLKLVAFLVKSVYHNNQMLLEYLKEDLKEFVPILLNAVEHERLHTVFVL